MRVVVIEPDGSSRYEDVEPDNTLAGLQSLVGGWIEALGLRPGLTAYINEEGKLNALPVNLIGTHVATQLGWRGFPGDVLVGPVVFCGFNALTGEDTDLPEGIVVVAKPASTYVE